VPRKYFLDWLRVAAFGVLMLFHIGLLYVPWNYNIKSDRIFSGLEYLLISISPWRLALLFFISGVAGRFLLDKLTPGRFAVDRFKRLFVVLLLGMWVINPIQVYVEFLDKGLIETGYFRFWLESYAHGEEFPNRSLPTWDHLWFLLYLLIYALGLALLFKLVKRVRVSEPPLALLLVAPCVWLCLTNVLIQEFRPVTMGLFDVLTLIGYAAGMLDQRSRALTYLTDAILPIYVVHQPIMLVAAYLMFPLSLPVFVEALLLVLVTGFGSLAVYEVLVRRWKIPRLLFGLKSAAPGAQRAAMA
jgi:surface polysaccharide O-acyltransferase-like enzyme